MKHQVLFIQGAGADTHDQWDNRLVDSLTGALGPDYDVRYPRMPDEADPNYARWKAALEDEFAPLEDGAILVGHSVGATILINVIAANPPPFKPGGVFLIAAPFIGKGGWPSEDVAPREKLGADLPDGVPVYLYRGNDDETVPLAHLELYAHAIPQAVLRQLDARDHQLNDDLRDVARDIRALR